MDFNVDAYLAQAQVWVLSDGKPGHENQSLGVCDALGVEPRLIRLEKRRWGKVLGWIYPAWYYKNLPTGPWPDLCVSAGYHVSDAAKWLKMKRQDTVLVHMMKPKGKHYRPFTVLAIPAHNQPKPASNVIVTQGAVHRISPERLLTEKAYWQQRLNPEGKPIVSVLIGGSTQGYVFDDAAAQRLKAQLTAQFSGNMRFLVSVSRRTPAKQVEALEAFFKNKESYFYKGEGENPYFGFLALADDIVVSAESVSMMSEACATTAPVYAFDLDYAVKRKKIKRFYEGMLALGRVKDLQTRHTAQVFQPQYEAGTVAAFIKSKIIQRHI